MTGSLKIIPYIGTIYIKNKKSMIKTDRIKIKIVILIEANTKICLSSQKLISMLCLILFKNTFLVAANIMANIKKSNS